MWFFRVVAGRASSFLSTVLEVLQRYECLSQYHHAGCVLPVNVSALPLHLIPFIYVGRLCGFLDSQTIVYLLEFLFHFR